MAKSLKKKMRSLGKRTVKRNRSLRGGTVKSLRSSPSFSKTTRNSHWMNIRKQQFKRWDKLSWNTVRSEGLYGRDPTRMGYDDMWMSYFDDREAREVKKMKQWQKKQYKKASNALNVQRRREEGERQGAENLYKSMRKNQETINKSKSKRVNRSSPENSLV